MSFKSDPDRLERLAMYVQDDPPNTSPQEIAEALNDAGERIRSLQERLHHALRTVADRDEWNDHLVTEVSIHGLVVPRPFRGWFVRRVERIRTSGVASVEPGDADRRTDQTGDPDGRG